MNSLEKVAKGHRGGDRRLPLQAETASSHRLGASGKQEPHGKLEKTNTFFLSHGVYGSLLHCTKKTNAVCIASPGLILAYWCEHLGGALMFCHVDYKA